MNGTIIIGGGQAGARAAIELRKAGYSDAITIFSGEDRPPYERPPLSKEVLVRGAIAGEPQVLPHLQLDALAIDLHLRESVTRIDPVAQTVTTQAGRDYVYDHLIVATGARARTLRIPGVEFAGVFTLRDADDAVRLRERLTSARRVAVIGGGVLGLEIAAAVRALGLEVTVMEYAQRCMERVLPAQALVPVMSVHADRAAVILNGVSVQAIEGETEPSAVVLADGARIECDLVVVAAGSVPNDALVAAAGGHCEGGVLVDAQCRSSLPEVFAIGDVAVDRASRSRRESWENANKQAAVVASAITGTPAPVESPAWFWTDQYDLNVQVLGTPLSGHAMVERPGSAPRQTVQFYLRDGILVGAVLFNSGRSRRAISKLIGAQIGPELLARADVALADLR
jgi:3-phenylpropionate/trans-cinnamate dioxygenase ferredoxin reductase component